jgi:SAM-dependent methyltransferase
MQDCVLPLGPDHRPTGGGWRKLSRGALHPLMRWRASRIARVLGSRLSKDETVLDVGTGDGMVAREIQRVSGARITGIDTVVYGNVGYPCLTYSGRRMPVEDSSFDSVLALFSLHHTSDIEAAVGECRRVSTGRVLIIEEVFRNKIEELFTKGEDWLANRLLSGDVDVPLQFRSLADWRAIFARQGLTVEKETRFFPLPFIPLCTMFFELRKVKT